MVNIHGSVVVKESNHGVPNLVVEAYVSDLNSQNQVSEHVVKDGFGPGILERMGKRIGSVLTDADGNFSLLKESSHFDSIKNKPGLLILVFAPEDVLDIYQPITLPPEKRILYMSTVPRTDVSGDEAYLIRLLQSQVDKFKIFPVKTTGPDVNGKIDSAGLSEAIEKTYLFRESFKVKLKNRLNDQEKKVQAMRQEAIRKTKDFSAIPLSKRNHPLLIKNQTDLKDAQHRSIKEGLKTLNKYKPKIKFSVSPDDLTSIGAEAKENKTSKVQTAKLADFIYNKIGGVSLVKTGVNNSPFSADDILKKYLKENKKTISVKTKKSSPSIKNKKAK